MGSYCSTLIVGDSGYSSLTEEEKKEFELVGLYDQEYIQKVLRDNKLATPYEKRSEWSDDPKETFDFIFNELTNGFADLIKLSEVEKLEDVDTHIYIKTLPKHMGPYKDGDLSQDEFLLEEKKAKKNGLLFIPKLFITKLHLIGAEGFQEDCIDEDWKMEEFCWMGSIDYEEICKEVDDVNLWIHKEMPLNYAQLGKIFGFGRPFVENCSTPLYEGKMYPSSFAEIFEWVNDDNLIVCKDETVVPIPQKEFVITN